jgi:hypothetical protein
MPTVSAQGKTFQCEQGANLRKVLLANGVDVYKRSMTVFGARAIRLSGEGLDGPLKMAGFCDRNAIPKRGIGFDCLPI